MYPIDFTLDGISGPVEIWSWRALYQFRLAQSG
jgi:hypothetical protein